MATYAVNLTPAVRHHGSEGSLDTAIMNGVSIQRTAYLTVNNSTNFKIASRVADGAEFTDVMPTVTDNDFIEAVDVD